MPEICSMQDDVTTAAEAIARAKVTRARFYSVDGARQQEIEGLNEKLAYEKSRFSKLQDENNGLNEIINALNNDARDLRSRLSAFERSDSICDYSIRSIQASVCAAFSIHRSALLQKTRRANVVRIRQIALFLCRTKTLRSLPEIGRDFGGLDHTTVLHAVRKVSPVWGSLPAVDGRTIVELARSLDTAWNNFYGSIRSYNEMQTAKFRSEGVSASG